MAIHYQPNDNFGTLRIEGNHRFMEFLNQRIDKSIVVFYSALPKPIYLFPRKWACLETLERSSFLDYLGHGTLPVGRGRTTG